MSGKIGYIGYKGEKDVAICLNPFYVREDWLHRWAFVNLPKWGLNPFYVREDWLHRKATNPEDYGCLNPFYVREDWLHSYRMKV